MKRNFLFCSIFIFILITNVTSQNNKIKIDKAVKYISEHPSLQHGRWSVYAKNKENGRVIADFDSEKIMYPASNLKLLTSAVALDM